MGLPRPGALALRASRAVLLALALLIHGTAGTRPLGRMLHAKQELRGPPYSIAHRGLAGMLPEHTLQGYQAAIEAGADFIECDVVATKDCQLICRHEPDLGGDTDANERFPELIRNVTIDGYSFEGVQAYDLTLEQVKSLRARQAVDIRDDRYDGRWSVPTFSEFLQVIDGASRVVGVYPETKHASFHDALGLGCWGGRTFTDAVLDELDAAGYVHPIDSPGWRQRPAFLQSLERSNLIEAAKRTQLPLAFILDELRLNIYGEEGTTYGDVIGSAAELEKLKAQGIAAIGPWKESLLPMAENNAAPFLDLQALPGARATAARVHEAGLQLVLYTFRNEAKRPDGTGYLAANYGADPRRELALWFEDIGADAAFTDDVHTMAAFLGKGPPDGGLPLDRWPVDAAPAPSRSP